MAANRLPFAFHSRYHLVTTTDVIDGFDTRFNLPSLLFISRDILSSDTAVPKKIITHGI